MEKCFVCGGEELCIEHTCRVKPYMGKTLRGWHCQSCGLVRFPENSARYADVISSSPSQEYFQRLRNAAGDQPGREFYMAEMGMRILGRSDGRISLFGSGLNKDYLLIGSRYPGAEVKLVDIENLQGVENYESIEDATPSDLIVASEVIEHFSDPVPNFRSLLGLLKTDGILLCSSNIYDGGDISRQLYPFVPGHVAYWTPLSLVKIASDHGCFVDFRTPEMALTRGGPRKRYIIFYRTTEVFFRVSAYFGVIMHAPSEKI